MEILTVVVDFAGSPDISILGSFTSEENAIKSIKKYLLDDYSEETPNLEQIIDEQSDEWDKWQSDSYMYFNIVRTQLDNFENKWSN